MLCCSQGKSSILCTVNDHILTWVKFLAVITILTLLTIPSAKASEPIMITLSGAMDKVIFDGKWTFYSEWKPTSLNTISYNDSELIQLRSAHQGNFIYILVDEVSNIKFNKNTDMAIICFDKNNGKTVIPNENDYCFGVPLDGKNPFTLRGSSALNETSHFMNIQNPNSLIGISSISDENDRYSNVPHASYEFKIPTDVVGRSDTYGFYLGVYNSHSNKIYSWPQNITNDSLLKIPSPSKWGDLVSPDKSLPEFPWPILALVSSLAIITFMTRRSAVFHR